MDKLKNFGTWFGLAIAVSGFLKVASVVPPTWHPFLDAADGLLGVVAAWALRAGLVTA